MYGNDFQFTLEAPKKSSRDFKGRKNVQKSKTSDITSSFRHRESQNKDETNLPKRMNQSSNQPILSKSIEDLSTKSSVSRKRLPSPNTHKPATEKASKWSKFLEKAESESDMDSE